MGAEAHTGSTGGEVRLMHVLEAGVGGTRRHVLDLCLDLPPRFRQHLVCSVLRDRRFEGDLERLRAAGIEVTVLPMVREIHLWQDYRCLRALRRLVQVWGPQVLHGHSAKAGFLARLAVGSPRPALPRLVYNPHGFPFQMRTSRWRHMLYVQLERWAGGRTDRLVAVGEGARKLALQERLVPDERVVIIRNGVQAEDFPVSVDREALSRALRVPEGAKVVGTVAALVPQKGLDRLLHAAAEFRGEPVHFLIAGEGPLHDDLRCLALALGVGEQVHFLGLRDDVPQLLQIMDVFALPSLWEGLPYAILEAGAAGVPVVASDIAGNRDLITPGLTGRLAGADLGAQLRAVFADETAARREAQALQTLVREQYTVERMVAGHVRMYDELVGQ